MIVNYGEHPDQQLQYFAPAHPSLPGAALIIHGGYWRQKYTAELGVPLAKDLAARGVPAYNLEYRRGPGSPQLMLDDARAALALIEQPGPISVIGHSAGGQLACLLAAHESRVSQVISQAGVLDLRLARELGLSHDAVNELLGPLDLAPYDPVQLWPVAARVILFHGRTDQDVPAQLLSSAVTRAQAVGQEHRWEMFEGDHYTWIDPTSAQWAACVREVVSLHGG